MYLLYHVYTDNLFCGISFIVSRPCDIPITYFAIYQLSFHIPVIYRSSKRRMKRTTSARSPRPVAMLDTSTFCTTKIRCVIFINFTNNLYYLSVNCIPSWNFFAKNKNKTIIGTVNRTDAAYIGPGYPPYGPNI